MIDYAGHGWFCSVDYFCLVVVKPENEAPYQRGEYVVCNYREVTAAVLNSMYDFNKLVANLEKAIEDGHIRPVNGCVLQKVPFGCV